MRFTEIAARASNRLGRALTSLALIALCMAFTQRPAAAQWEQWVRDCTPYPYVDSYGNMWVDFKVQVLVAPNYDSGPCVEIDSGGYVPGLVPPDYNDCSCTSYTNQQSISGYYEFWADLENFEYITVGWDIWIMSAEAGSCGDACYDCENPQTQSLYAEYYDYVLEIIDYYDYMDG